MAYLISVCHLLQEATQLLRRSLPPPEVLPFEGGLSPQARRYFTDLNVPQQFLGMLPPFNDHPFELQRRMSMLKARKDLSPSCATRERKIAVYEVRGSQVSKGIQSVPIYEEPGQCAKI